jgi:D-serine deaminase-like pyridoxal phosphate-dependent protein
MIFTRIANFASRNKLTLTAFVLGAFVASAGIVTLAQQAPASAASNETNIGKQVVTVGKTKTTTTFNVCKISQGGGYYKVRVRATHSSAVLLANNGYSVKVSSSQGSTVSNSKAISSRVATTSVSSKSKSKASTTFTAYVGKGSNSGYANTPGTTLRSFTVGSIRTC